MEIERQPGRLVINVPGAPLWLIGIALAILAAGMFVRSDQPVLPAALAQATRQAGARGVFAFSGQLSENSYGLFLVDVDAGTIWCYEYLEGKKKFRLAGARSWLFDRYLEDQDFLGPSPDEVEQMVEQQRLIKLRNRGAANP